MCGHSLLPLWQQGSNSQRYTAIRAEWTRVGIGAQSSTRVALRKPSVHRRSAKAMAPSGTVGARTIGFQDESRYRLDLRLCHLTLPAGHRSGTRPALFPVNCQICQWRQVNSGRFPGRSPVAHAGLRVDAAIRSGSISGAIKHGQPESVCFRTRRPAPGGSSAIIGWTVRLRTVRGGRCRDRLGRPLGDHEVVGPVVAWGAVAVTFRSDHRPIGTGVVARFDRGR